jgi:hypothetical protein
MICVSDLDTAEAGSQGLLLRVNFGIPNSKQVGGPVMDFKGKSNAIKKAQPPTRS